MHFAIVFYNPIVVTLILGVKTTTTVLEFKRHVTFWKP